MLVSLTVGKVDAGLAILLTSDKRLIEFPSVLLPPGVSSGSIVDIEVSRNVKAEEASRIAFEKLQEEIYQLFGQRSPSKPVLRVRNVTQTSVVLEWDPVDLATAHLRTLSLYRNNSKAGNIPNPITHHSTKISGLAVDTEYTFHLVLRTSAGIFTSDKVTVRTHKMSDLSGITICPGSMSPSDRDMVADVIKRIGAKPLQDYVRIDTTHFICTEGRGQGWERAQEMNIPIVRPEWLEACEHEGRIVGVRNYYLTADPSARPPRSRPAVPAPQPQSPAPPQEQQMQQQQQQQQNQQHYQQQQQHLQRGQSPSSENASSSDDRQQPPNPNTPGKESAIINQRAPDSDDEDVDNEPPEHLRDPPSRSGGRDEDDDSASAEGFTSVPL